MKKQLLTTATLFLLIVNIQTIFAQTPKMVKDIYAGSSSADPSNLIVVNGTLFFGADNGMTNGDELWKSDGTDAGTVLVKDIRPGSNGSSPIYLTDVNGILFFNANDGTNGNELWKSDGTAAGTVMVKDIASGSTGSYPDFLTDVNGALFFVADNGTNGKELWKSDGTAAGTVMVKDIASGSNTSRPDYLTNVNGTLFFSADETGTNEELWKSDGTAAGTVMVKEISSPFGSNPEYLTNMNGTLFFGASEPATGLELWKSDGTAAGTVIVKEINPSGSDVYTPDNLTDVNGTLYFRANDDGATYGRELWKTDGTAAGTVLVKDIVAGTGSPAALEKFTNVNGVLYFLANDGTNGNELWKSDGTTAGTVMVKDIGAGAASSGIDYITNLNGTLYFRAATSTYGYELWKSDGTDAGTVLVSDIRPGSQSSQPKELVSFNGTLYFNATDGTKGQELWMLDTIATSAPAAPSNLTASPGKNLGMKINLSWQDNSNDELGFVIERSPNGTSSWVAIDTVLADVSVYSDSGLSAGTPYYYQVYAYNGNGNSPYSNIANAITLTGIEQTAVGNSQFAVSIYPNPFSKNTLVRITNGYEFANGKIYDLQFTIYNLLGEEVFLSHISHSTFHISPELSNGIYFYKIQNENKTLSTGKLIVQ